MESPVKEKTVTIKEVLRQQQKTALFKQIRDQLMSCLKQQTKFERYLELLVLGYQQLEKQEADQLNLYVNLQPCLNFLIDSQNHHPLPKKLAVNMFIELTQHHQVITMLAQQNPERQLIKMLSLLNSYPQFTQYLYERTKVLLEEICSQGQILTELLNIKMTTFLINLEPQSDQDSSYYDLLSLYINYVPNSHLIPIINSGFALKSFYCENKTIFLALLGRLQAEGQKSEQFAQIYRALVAKRQECQQKVYQ